MAKKTKIVADNKKFREAGFSGPLLGETTPTEGSGFPFQL